MVASSSDSAQIPQTPTGGGLTYEFVSLSGVNLANLNSVIVWKATATSTQTFTMSVGVSPNNAAAWGFLVVRFAGVAATGATKSDSNATASLPSSTITTTKAGSRLVMALVDRLDRSSAQRLPDHRCGCVRRSPPRE